MNVYQRLTKARVELQKQPMKESGKNTFANYTYLELGDFLPRINTICSEVGLCGVVTFGKEEASLTIVNTDKPEETIVFGSPMSTAELKGCHAIQNLGAVQSYLRRYLWMAAFEIVEHDALDSTNGKDKAATPAPASQSGTQAKQSATQTKYFPLVRGYLSTLFGDDVTAKQKECLAVAGVDDYRTLDGKKLEALAAKLKLTVDEFTKKDMPL